MPIFTKKLLKLSAILWGSLDCLPFRIMVFILFVMFGFTYYLIYNRPSFLHIGFTIFKSGVVILEFKFSYNFLRSELYMFNFYLSGKYRWEERSVFCKSLYNLSLYLIDQYSCCNPFIALMFIFIEFDEFNGQVFIIKIHQTIVNNIVVGIGISIWVCIHARHDI